jgi:hypothetical protein
MFDLNLNGRKARALSALLSGKSVKEAAQQARVFPKGAVGIYWLRITKKTPEQMRSTPTTLQRLTGSLNRKRPMNRVPI